MPDPKKKLDLSAGNAILKSSQKIDLSAGDAILKKKEFTQPTSQESVWGSNSQPKDAYTSLVIDQQIPQQESVISDGEQPKMRTLGVDITAEEALKPTPKKQPVIDKSIQKKIKNAEFKPKEYRNLGSKLVDKFAAGSSQLGVDISAVPELVYDVFAAPQNAVADIFDIPSLKADSEEFKSKLNIHNSVKDYYQRQVSELNQKSKELDKQYSQGVYDSFINGDYSSGFDQLISSFVESLPTTAAIMVGGAYAKAPQILATSTMVFGANKSEQLKQQNPELSTNARVANSLATGFAQAATETLGSASIGSAAKALVSREGEKKAVTILRDGLSEYYKNALKKSPLTASALGEGIGEWSSKVAENAIDVATGIKPNSYNVFEGGADALLGGVFGGAVFGAGLTGIKNTVNAQDQKTINDNTKKIFDLQSQLENQTISPEIKQEINTKIASLITENERYVKEDISKIESLPDDVKEKLISSTNKIDELTAKAKEINESNEITIETKSILLEDLKKKAIENAELKSSILNGTYVPDRTSEQEQKAEEVTPVETTEEETTIKETIRPTTEVAPTETTPQVYVEELAKTKASDPETYWSVSEVSEEDAAKGTIIDTPDGSALVKPDGDIAGLFKKLTSKAKGVAQDLLNKSVAAGGIKLDNFDGYLTKQYEKAGFRIVSRVPFSLEYGVPDGYNKEKHGTPDVVAMIYDPNNELDIEEKTFEDYDEAIAYRDGFVDQAKALTTEVNTIQEVIDESEKSNDLPSLVQKAKTALSKILPNTKIVLYDTEAEYKAAINEGTDENSGGAFVQGKIHINPNRANGRTVAHEVFHAILLNMVKSDPAAQRVTAAMITAIEKVLPPDMKAKLQDFVENGYDAQRELWDEEKLAELVGYLAENFSSLSQPAKNIIKQWLDQLAKLVGLKEFTDKEVIDFMNTISGKVARGEEITEEDVKMLKPTSGVSTTGLKLNTENVSGRKQADTIKDRKQSNRPSVNQIYDQSEQAIKDRNKNASIKDLGPYLRKSLLDRQAYIKRLLDRIDNKSAKKAYDLLVTKAGASALATERFKQAEKEIYGKLNSEDTKTLDKIIYARRIVAVNESRAQLGMPAYTGIDGYSLEDAKQDLADFKQELGDKKFNELSDRATTYFNVFKANLRKLYDSGRISKEVYDSLRNTEYSPIKTIKYIIGDNLSPDEIDTQAKSLGISRKDIMKLSDSNENEIILDSKWLLAMNIGSVEGRAFENRMLNEFNKAIESTTADEKKAFEEFVLDNPVVGKKKDGGLKYKYDDAKVPVGYTKVSFFENGNKREIVLKDVYAKQLLDVKNKNAFLETIGNLTGTQILRFFATGGNPLFIIGNTAVDFQNIAFWSDTYSKFKPLAAAQLMRDFTKNFVKKAVMNNKHNAIFNEYINHGGALDYLSNDGLKALESMNPVKSVTKQAQKGLLAYGRAMAFLGETSEVAFRMSVFEKVKEDSLKDFRKENGREPNFQEKEDILWKAAREARETMDFSQGGDVAKNIDSVFPYFNAALQGVRRPIDFAMKNPAGFASSVLQYTAMAGSLTAASLAMLIKSVRDDEEDDEEANKKILQVLNSVSEYEKANYHVLFTGNKNKDGEYEYYRIKKLPVLSVISTIGDQLIYNDFFKNVGIDYKIDKEAIQEAAVKSNPLPMTVQELAGKNPVASGLVSYWANKDTFTGEKIFREPNNKKILPEAEGIFDDKVDQVYKDLAPGFGLSPARTKVMVEKVITSENTNPTIPLIYSAYDGIFNKKDGLGNEVSEAMSNVGKAFGKKLVRYTDKNIIRYKKQDEMEYKESVTETDIWKKEQKVYNEIKSAYKEGDGLTQKQLVSLVKENFEPIDRLKYVKKYNAYIHNMNIDKSVLDIIFEDVPEVQAMKLNQRYGANLEKEEMKELGQAMGSAGRKINTKAMYIYNKKYKERKPAN